MIFEAADLSNLFVRLDDSYEKRQKDSAPDGHCSHKDGIHQDPIVVSWRASAHGVSRKRVHIVSACNWCGIAYIGSEILRIGADPRSERCVY